ncbi:hypothetical protein ACVNF4_07455 [Streptomyces sp. S6]
MSEGSAAGTGITGPAGETGVSSREGRVVGGEAWDEAEPAAGEGGALWREVRGAGVFGRRPGRPSDEVNTDTQDTFPPPVASARFPDTTPATPRPGARLGEEQDIDGSTAVSDFDVSVVRPYMSRTAAPASAPASDTPRPPTAGSAWTPFSRSRMAPPPKRPSDEPRSMPADTPAWTPTSSACPPEFDIPFPRDNGTPAPGAAGDPSAAESGPARASASAGSGSAEERPSADPVRGNGSGVPPRPAAGGEESARDADASVPDDPERPAPARPGASPAPEDRPSPSRTVSESLNPSRTAQDTPLGTIPPRPATPPKSARPGTSRVEPGPTPQVSPPTPAAARTDSVWRLSSEVSDDTPAPSSRAQTQPRPSYGSAAPHPDPSLSWTATPRVHPMDTPPVEADPREPWVRGRVVAAAACVVLGLGLMGGAVTGSWLVGGDAQAAGGSYAAASAIWHSVPVDQLFPVTVDGQGAGPGGADRTWTRIGVAPDGGCENAFDPLLAQVLTPVGCDRLLRATYIDATQSYVTTVGLLFTKADAATMRALDARFEKEGLSRRADLMPRPYAVPDTLAARFGTAQRASWSVSVLTDAPVVVYSVSGWADNRTVDTPQPAAEATATGAGSAVAQAGLGNEAKGLADRVERSLRKAAAAPTEQPS